MKICLVILLFVCSTSFAKLDYSVNNTLRTLPLGIFSEGNIGKSIKLWHRPSYGEKDILFGYARIGVKLRTSGLINSAGINVDIFPISFFGFFGGVDYYKRSSDDLHKFNCEIYACEGDLRRVYFGSKLALKWKNFFVREIFKIEKMTPEITDKKFVDEQSSFLGAAGGDSKKMFASVVGYELSKRYSVGVLNVYSKMKYEDVSSSLTLGLFIYKRNKWNYTFGIGTNKSSSFPTSMTTVLRAVYTGEKGLALF